MKKTLTAALIGATMVSQADAQYTFLIAPMEFIDGIVMMLFKPVIWQVYNLTYTFACESGITILGDTLAEVMGQEITIDDNTKLE